MFKVTPVTSPYLQQDTARRLGAPYLPDTYAFQATEMTEDAEPVCPLALCQFSFSGKEASLKSLDWAPDHEQDEAVVILVRTVMNWLWRADISLFVCADSRLSEVFCRRLGFRYDSGRWQIDLDLFYRSPCSYTEQNT